MYGYIRTCKQKEVSALGYVTAAQAARIIGVSDKTVRTWVKAGILSADHPAKNRMAIPRAEVEQLAQERARYQEPATTPGTANLTHQVAELKNEINILKQKVAVLEKKSASGEEL
jgi:excisionase family DNA binding protein